MNTEQATGFVRAALMQVVPGPEVAELAADESLRDTLEMDSLDFLAFVENLSAATGVRIDEDDYPKLNSLDSCAHFLTAAGITA